MNYAELQKAIDDGTIALAQCRRMGQTHRAYGWSCTPHGHWSGEQKQAYIGGYREQV